MFMLKIEVLLKCLNNGNAIILYHKVIIKEVGKYEGWSGKWSNKEAVKVISLQ